MKPRGDRSPVEEAVLTTFVSVVVPTRDRAGLLSDCLGSLLNQEFPVERYEIIVVDDGSQDETRRVVARIHDTLVLPTLKYVKAAVTGLNAARNAGIREALGDAIMFVDDDVLAPPSWLSAMVDGFLRHPEASDFGGPTRVRLEGKGPSFCAVDRLDGEFYLGDAEVNVRGVIGANMGIRRRAIQAVGLFDESLSGSGDETEWELRLVKAGGQIVYLPKAWLWHRRTAADLRLFTMLGKRFRRGVEEVTFASLVGHPIAIGHELASVPRFLAHAARRWCVGGLLSASTRMGRVWGLIGRGLSRYLSRR